MGDLPLGLMLATFDDPDIQRAANREGAKCTSGSEGVGVHKIVKPSESLVSEKLSAIN
jgi:hypothetical protein